MAEEVLLTVESVRHKKIEGTLCLSHTMIRWFRKNAQQAEITIEYRDIKAQRVSPDTKPKVQLQVTKYNNDSYVFHFATPGNDEESKAKGMANRMAVKEMLSQKLPLHRNQRNQELDVKIQVLQKNDTLYAMYKDLVVNGVMEADEFWSLRQVNALVERRKELKSDGSSDSCSLISGVTKVGVSSSFMSDIKPISDKGQKFILTQDLINDIWRTYPWLKDVHTGLIKNSPSGKKEEVEEKFWKKFFMSSWYERHRIPASNEKVFVDSEPDADYGWLTSAAKEFGASLYADDNEPATLISGQTVQVRSEFDSGDKKYLLQNFNKHSMAILGAQFRKRKIKDNGKETNNSKNSKLIDGGSVVGSGSNGGGKHVARRNSVNQASNHIAMSSGSLLQHNRMLESGQSEKMERLSLTEGRIEDFLCGPAGIARHNEVSGIADPKKAIQDWISVCRNVRIETDFTKVVDVRASQQVLKHVAENVVVKTANETANHLVTDDVDTRLKEIHLSAQELLRLFWTMFPITDTEKFGKLKKIKTSLEKYRDTTLSQVRDMEGMMESIPRSVLGEVEEQIRVALDKFASIPTNRYSN